MAQASLFFPILPPVVLLSLSPLSRPSRSGAEASFEYASAFFVRLVEQCATQIHADILFSHLINDTRFIDGLLDCISQSSDDASKVRSPLPQRLVK